MNAYRTVAARLIRRNAGLDNNGYSYPVEFSLRVAAPTPSSVRTVLQSNHRDVLVGMKGSSLHERILRRAMRSLDVAVTNLHLDLVNHDDWRSPVEHVRKAWGFSAFSVQASFDVVGIEGGHHLVLTSFQGIDLRGWSSHELAQAIESGDLGSNAWVRELGCMLQDWSEAFAPDGIQELLAYHVSELAYGDLRKTASNRLEDLRREAGPVLGDERVHFAHAHV